MTCSFNSSWRKKIRTQWTSHPTKKRKISTTLNNERELKYYFSRETRWQETLKMSWWTRYPCLSGHCIFQHFFNSSPMHHILDDILEFLLLNNMLSMFVWCVNVADTFSSSLTESTLASRSSWMLMTWIPDLPGVYLLGSGTQASKALLYWASHFQSSSNVSNRLRPFLGLR